MSTDYRDWLILILPSAFILLLLLYVIRLDPYVEKRKRKPMQYCVLTVSLTLLFEILHALFELYDLHYMRTLVDIGSYVLRPLAIVLLMHILQPEKKFLHAWILLAINTAVHLTATFSKLVFWIDETGAFARGPLGYTSHVVGVILLAELCVRSVRTSLREKKRDSLLSVIIVLLILVGLILDTCVFTDGYLVSMTTYVMVIACVFYYLWLHLRFVADHENALRAEERIQLMISQIQPHFLYNTLTTIQALCRDDPEKAYAVTTDFSAYLRHNIDSLSQSGLIPFEKELEHTRIYAEIEAIRFPNVHVEYDIRDVSFAVPALTLQPLVENAVRHGVRIRKEGLIRIRTAEENGFHTITISDNGKGFDTGKLELSDFEHSGIKTVRDRIESLCGGELEIVSRPDEGVTVTIRIPTDA